MAKRFILLACLFGGSAVIIGAFGAHILKKILIESDLQTYEIGVRYQFYHTFALLAAALLSRYTNKKWMTVAGWLFAAGIVFFSGSLYLLALSTAFELEFLRPILGPMTPFGGLLFIGGWLFMFVAGISYKARSKGHSHHRSSRKASSEVS